MYAVVGIVKRLALIFGMALAIFGVGKTANAVMGVQPPNRAPIVDVESGNPAMKAAHAKARATISEFWASVERKAPNERGHSLKVRLPLAGPGGAAGEHMWVDDVTRTDSGAFSGRLQNVPKYATNYQLGQRITFTESMISDWMFRRSGKIVGNESMRPLLARMPPQDAERYRAMLETP